MSLISVRFQPGPSLRIELGESETTSALTRSLPFRSRAETWGMEVYFSAPFHVPLDDKARAEMEIGEVAFWPDGDAMAIFYGPTPASTSGKPRAVGPCNIVGRVVGDASDLARVKAGARVSVESG